MINKSKTFHRRCPLGRPIQKKWFTAKAGSVAGNLQVICNIGSGAETKVIDSQVGTGKYRVDSGEIVKLVDKASGSLLEGEAVLEHDGKTVSKLNQYRVYYFDGSVSGVWRDTDGNVVGTFVPALATEDGDIGAPVDSQAILSVTTAPIDADGEGDIEVTEISIVDAGYGYDTAPTITLTVGDGTPATTATATCTIDGLGRIDSITITENGSYASGTTVTATVPAP
jgi:hypothetical protein